jgi:DNA modification methylase
MIRSGTNALFQCDAICLLERLPDNAVALAYLDPPWNTHSKRGRPKEDLADDSEEQYVLSLSRTVQQIRRVLNEAGSLFVHWSPTSPLDVRLVMNQAFGEQPRYEITWHRKSPSQLPRGVPNTEFILVYSKSETPVYNALFRTLSPDEKSAYGANDSRGEYRLVELTVPFDRPTAQYTWRGFRPPAKRSWRFSSEKMGSLLQEEMIHFPASGGMPRKKQYLCERAGVEIGTTWTDIPAFIQARDRAGYASQQPIALMERVIELASQRGDQILDPFFGSGTTLVAAHNLGRHWWGADNADEAHHVTVKRLNSLDAGRDYVVLSHKDVVDCPIVFATYRDVLASIHDIAQLQQVVKTLTQHILELKRLMSIPNDASAVVVEEAIKQMEHWITTSIAHQSVRSYIAVVCSWLTGWDHLEKASQSFLPQAEMLFEGISQSDADDYSPFIIQYCRALENEILKKLFSAYTNDVHMRIKDVAAFLSEELKDEKTGTFARKLLKRGISYTLGEMSFILNLMKEGGSTLHRSVLLKDFRAFVVRYFGERILDKTYLQQIDNINSDFRCKAAHPYILNAEVAQRCRVEVRACLNELILHYRHGDHTGNT